MKTVLCDPRADAVLARLDDEAKKQSSEMRRYYDAKKLQPIIVKKVKKGGHAAHGGAWKIAYADFVTAMMAFFLLMWLLGSTSKEKKGLTKTRLIWYPA